MVLVLVGPRQDVASGVVCQEVALVVDHRERQMVRGRCPTVRDRYLMVRGRAQDRYLMVRGRVTRVQDRHLMVRGRAQDLYLMVRGRVQDRHLMVASKDLVP